MSSRVTGFASPSTDFSSKNLDLNELLIKKPAATFFSRAVGNSMQGVGIFDGDILIVDRSYDYQDGSIVIAVFEGDLICKIVDLTNNQLISASDDIEPINVTEDMDVVIEGVVISSIRNHSDVCSS